MQIVISNVDPFVVRNHDEIDDMSMFVSANGKAYASTAYDIMPNGEMQVVVVSDEHRDEQGAIPLNKTLCADLDSLELAVRNAVISKMAAFRPKLDS